MGTITDFLPKLVHDFMGQGFGKGLAGCSSLHCVASAEATGAGGSIVNMASSLTGLELRFSKAS